MFADEVEYVVVGVLGLDDDLSGDFSASSSSRNLREELKRTFAGSEIRNVERKVGVDHAHQGHIWEVVSFRNHLRADHDVDISGGHLIVDGDKVVMGAGGVAVKTGIAGAWKHPPDIVFKFLGAKTVEAYNFAGTLGAGFWYSGLEVAVMA